MAPVVVTSKAVTPDTMRPQGTQSRQPSVEDGSPYMKAAEIANGQPTETSNIPQPDSQQLPYRTFPSSRQTSDAGFGTGSRVYDSPGPMTPVLPAQPSPAPSISKQSTVELGRGDVYYDDNEMDTQSAKPFAQQPAPAVQPSDRPQERQYQTSAQQLPPQYMMQPHPMYGPNGHYQPMPQDPRFGQYMQQYPAYGSPYPLPGQYQLQPTRGHSFKKVTLSGNARAIQGNVMDPRMKSTLYRDHDFGEVEAGPGTRLFQGNVTSEEMKNFWD